MHISWARLASFCHLGFISDPLIVSKFHNETHDRKGHENKIYTIVKGRETFYHRHTIPVTSCIEVKYVLKRVSFGSKDCTKECFAMLRRFLWFAPPPPPPSTFRRFQWLSPVCFIIGLSPSMFYNWFVQTPPVCLEGFNGLSPSTFCNWTVPK